MSFLDDVLTGGGGPHAASHLTTDPIPVATLAENGLMAAADKTALAAAELDIAAVQDDIADAQLELASLQAQIDAANARLTALKATQGVYVEDYTAGGAPLSAANFEAALNAAITAAAAMCGAPENDETQVGSVPVYVPQGNWLMMQGIVLHNIGPKRAPSLIGRGAPGSVVLRFHPSATFAGIMLGCNPDGTIQGAYCTECTIENIHIFMAGGVATRGGIRARNTLITTIRNVAIRGAGAELGPWHQRVGIDFRNNNLGETPTPDQNHQHIYLENVWVSYALVGLWLGEAAWSATIINCSINGCEHTAVYEGAVVGWFGGNVQGGIGEGARHSSGMMYADGLPGGAAADVTASSGGLSTVSNVSGLQGYEGDGASATMRGSFITIGDNIYRIESIIDGTSCVIYRATGGALSGQAWQVRGCRGGNQIQLTGGTYTETTYGRALLHVGRDFVTSSGYFIDSVVAKVAEVVCDVNVCEGRVSLRNTFAPGVLPARLRQCREFDTDTNFGTIDTDDVSRGGITAKNYSSRPRSLRYNDMFLERGGGCFDARRTASIIRSGTDITSWTDIANLSTLTRIIPANAPQFIAFDAALGAPAVEVWGELGAGLVRGLAGDIGNQFPAGVRFPTLFVVARIPDASAAAGGTRRVSISGTNISTYIGFDDNGHSVARDFYARTWWNVGQAISPNLVASDELAHWLFATNLIAERFQAGGGSEITPWGVGSTNWGHHARGIEIPGTATLSLMIDDSASTGHLYVSHVGWLPRGITEAEREQFKQAALNEFNIEP